MLKSGLLDCDSRCEGICTERIGVLDAMGAPDIDGSLSMLRNIFAVSPLVSPDISMTVGGSSSMSSSTPLMTLPTANPVLLLGSCDTVDAPILAASLSWSAPSLAAEEEA